MLSQNKKEQPYPLSVRIYKGEGRLLFVPMVKHIYGYSVTASNSYSLDETEKDVVVGKTVLEALKFIKNSPRSSATPKELENYDVFLRNSKYKSFISFWKNNHFAYVDCFENGNFVICSLSRDKSKGMYDTIIKKLELKEEQNPEIIGQAVVDVLTASEEYYANLKNPPQKMKKEIDLLDGTKLTYIQPPEKEWEDTEDCGAAEIYQSYSYNKGSSDTAVMYFGIAAELDCDITEQHVLCVSTKMYGEPDMFEYKSGDFGVFDICVELKNKNIHKVSYYKKQSDDLLLECTLEVYKPNSRMKTDEKLVVEFRNFIKTVTI